MRVVFIFGELSSHATNRVIDFKNAGFDVEVLAFKRKGRSATKPTSFNVTELGEIEDEKYLNRLSLYRRTIRSIVNKYGRDDVYYFVSGLDLAIFAYKYVGRQKFFYEEADLVHTYIKNRVIRNILEWTDRYVIRKSKYTLLTSDGFAKYHFGDKIPSNVRVVTNRLNSAILDLNSSRKGLFNPDKIKIGFVGYPRFDSVFNFIDCYCKNFPSYEFHVYGAPVEDEFKKLEKYENCIFHGRFSNPIDLSGIYSNLDLVLSTYDVKYDNVRYAEPNKIYEAIYFETPIIVSEGTFLAEKVNRMNIGFAINPLDNDAIVSFIKGLTPGKIADIQNSCAGYPKDITINDNSKLMNEILENC